MAGRSRGKSRKVVPVAESKGDAAGAPRSSATTPEEVFMVKQRPMRTVQANGANTPSTLPCPIVKDHDEDMASIAKQIIEDIEMADLLSIAALFPDTMLPLVFCVLGRNRCEPFTNSVN
ncbi:hypothetical protein R1sor_024081 [Riccia sorocarpa]|uniref:Uncharacterized protein n=1 Tax=Riccia sorocarpa TaxID=122646 RepID=A0ABD3GSP2_9MARC